MNNEIAFKPYIHRFSLLILLGLLYPGYTPHVVQAETTSIPENLYLDELDLEKTECGWGHTTARKTVDGNPLRLNGKVYERGVGHHAPGRILVALPVIQGRFRCEVGIDDETDGRGHAEFLVYGDGKPLWRSGFVKGGETAKICDISIDGLKQLALVMDSGPEGYALDHGDWLDARFEIHGASGRENPATQSIRTLSPGAVIMDDTGMEIERSDEAACEFLALSRELAKGIDVFRAGQSLRPEAIFLNTDRDPVDIVLRRTRALMQDLRTFENGPKLTGEEKQLDGLDAKNQVTDLNDTPARQALFAEVVSLREKIALQNPLLDFSDILFIKRHVTPEPEKQGNHMCDQFFGFHATKGGGLFVLKHAFDPSRRSVGNLLENSKVESGRYKNARLDSSWGFLAPELSFDANKILFAATDTASRRHSYIWSDDNCYHLFEVNADGSGLKQLTDGPWNDIDPCFLPNGRIVFVSERRGGFGRCHARPCPNYTLFSMLPDGGDITMLSPHETNEWAPMVDHNGMIVYTRWDYVDRGFNQAHHPWITFPDGRDPRAIQGNYSEDERSRPHFETSLRPVPDSPKLVGTAQPHHGQYFGSIILLDPNVPDDEEGGEPMGSLRRVTPEQLFPEAENAAHRDAANYGQPFPLSEDYYLVAYDAFSGMGKGHVNNYGLYLLDSFGNKILLYRDVEISCQCPIALKPRPVPPVIPHQTLVGLPPGRKASIETTADDEAIVQTLPERAEVGVMNVYETNRPFPENTKIKELRIVQILPKTTTHANVPWIGYGNDTGARKVLGTVPVQEDGSVFFEMPVDVPVYFQALDEDGVAVQTMRSSTYVKPGERLTCLGCHEGRQSGTSRFTTFPAAFRKKPEPITPEMDGSNPFNYPRLIQPILDRHCVQCHETEAKVGKTFPLDRGDMDLPRSLDPRRHFFESYVNLRPHVFVFKGVYQNRMPELMNPLPNDGTAWNSFAPARTFPGKFGANASPLWHLLKSGHYEVRLSPAEMRAMALWLDNNADFYGAYELETLDAQRRGETVLPGLE
ncbi:MAG TPA: hypothetical protein DEB39_14180 [Planctomycetaceae bacterium]|nr:hypothetical protein [Planctomycetaceae bacterium]